MRHPRGGWAALALIGIAVGGCRSPSRGHGLPAAGSPGDDGTGLLARASQRLLLGGTAARGYGGAAYGDSAYGGATYGDGYGGTGPAAAVVRRPEYAAVDVPDGGAVEGVVRWPRPPPAPARLRISGCGDIANPTVRRRPGGEVEGALVYLVGVSRGRPFAGSPAGRSMSVGGLVEKRGCALWPPLQVLAPAPGVVMLSNGDAPPVTLLGTGTWGFRVELGAGDRRTVPAGLGATRVVDASEALAPAWVIGLGHPYFALTDAEGRFRIDDVPPGEHQLAVWVPPPATGAKDGRVMTAAPIEVRRAVVVGPLARLRLSIDLPARR